jgi:acetyl-CoA carboxylase biotin carboxyl carrier protein
MDVKDLKKLLDAVQGADISELTLETGDYKLTVKRGGAAPVAPAAAPPPPQPAPVQAAAPAPAPAPAPAALAGEAPEVASDLVEVTAPIVGTFYAAPSPDAPPYVRVGDKVEPGTVLCIIEAMKLMNEIEAEVAGVVVDVLVRNEEPVEYGQVLFRIKPS